jgi:hypothetical protein
MPFSRPEGTEQFRRRRCWHSWHWSSSWTPSPTACSGTSFPKRPSHGRQGRMRRRPWLRRDHPQAPRRRQPRRRQPRRRQLPQRHAQLQPHLLQHVPQLPARLPFAPALQRLWLSRLLPRFVLLQPMPPQRPGPLQPSAVHPPRGSPRRPWPPRPRPDRLCFPVRPSQSRRGQRCPRSYRRTVRRIWVRSGLRGQRAAGRSALRLRQRRRRPELRQQPRPRRGACGYGGSAGVPG